LGDFAKINAARAKIVRMFKIIRTHLPEYGGLGQTSQKKFEGCFMTMDLGDYDGKFESFLKLLNCSKFMLNKIVV